MPLPKVLRRVFLATREQPRTVHKTGSILDLFLSPFDARYSQKEVNVIRRLGTGRYRTDAARSV